jgi:hypothetical protein
MTGAYKIRIEPVSQGATLSTKTTVNGDANTPPSSVQELVVRASNVQIAAISFYLNLINSGATTTTVETAINNLV